MVSGGGGSKSKYGPIFKYLPEQKAYLRKYAKTWWDIFTGNFSSPTAQALQNLVYEAGMREAAQQRQQLLETRGLSTPARQQALASISEGAIRTAATVPQQLFAMAAEWLGQYTLQPPAVGGAGKSASAPQIGICSCDNLKSLNEDTLLDSLRTFRDAHFAPNSDIDRGYKAMSSWFVPLVKRNSLVKKLGRLLLLHPLTFVAEWTQGKNTFGFLFLPFAYFWVWTWKLYGRLTHKSFSQRTPRPTLSSYQPMSLTFLNRLMEVF